MNKIKYIVRETGSNKPPIFTGEMDYKGALILNQGMRLKILSKIYTVQETKFNVSKSETDFTIYV